MAHATDDATRILRAHPDAPPGPATSIFSVNGVVALILGGQGKDRRPLVVGAVQPPVATPEGPVIQTPNVRGQAPGPSAAARDGCVAR
ncbi:MAG: hypothetical protein ACUVS4_17435 [Chloroflexaceae bacterium]